MAPSSFDVARDTTGRLEEAVVVVLVVIRLARIGEGTPVPRPPLTAPTAPLSPPVASNRSCHKPATTPVPAKV